MQKTDLISVVMPAYNASSTIAQAIDSVLIQEVSLEILVIDDGSSDGLEQVMACYRDDDRVIYLKNETNLGPAETRNRGVREAKGKYIAFLDADDYWADGKLIKQYELIKEKDMVLCATGRSLITHDGKLMNRNIPVKELITYEDMLQQNWINNSSVLVRKEVLLEFPMEADDVHEDYLLWLKVLKKYKQVCAINEPLLFYRMSKNSKSGSKWKSARMTYHTYRKLGMNKVQAWKCFVSYAIAGVKKYYG